RKDGFERSTAFAVAAGVLAPAGCMVQGAAVAVPLGVQLAVYLAALFACCMVCHGELALARPAPQFLTGFYLFVAAGAPLGGVFAALIARRLSTEFSESRIGLGAACLLGFAGWIRSGALQLWTSRNFAIRLPLMALLLGGVTAVVATITPGGRPAVASAR